LRPVLLLVLLLVFRRIRGHLRPTGKGKGDDDAWMLLLLLLKAHWMILEYLAEYLAGVVVLVAVVVL